MLPPHAERRRNASPPVRTLSTESSPKGNLQLLLTGRGQTVRSVVYQLLIAGGSLGAIAISVRRWPPVVKQWGSTVGMVCAAAAYLAAETPGQEKWALGVAIVNAVLVVYVVVRRLARSRSSSRDR
jgi:hypothetical protein